MDELRTGGTAQYHVRNKVAHCVFYLKFAEIYFDHWTIRSKKTIFRDTVNITDIMKDLKKTKWVVCFT